MALNSRAQTYQQVGQLSSAIVGGVLLSLVGQRSTPGQIVPDGTLGAESSVVMPNVEVRGAGADRIDGGALRGANLFHSFDQFGVENLQRVYFSNPTGVENILSRVTGANSSQILGTLGVDGGANLYLVNPRGILFGPDARLDVAGSFVASTAESLVLGDNLIFSAVDPSAPPVLMVNIQPGVQLGNLPTTSTLTNRGNLSIGQDLTLAAGNLDLQGQLQAGGSLTLQAADTVKIRDTVAEPFVARSGGKLLVQGNQQVDIFALNHSQSGLFSGGDMTLRAVNAVGGDAHFWSGGDFRIEQLDGSLGDLYSPYDPVIQSQGNVFLAGYSGGSLQILAGGSVMIPGTITILNSAADFNDSTITLSDSSSLTITGTNRPALDIRAGTNQFFSAPALGVPTSAEITLGDVRILNSLFVFPFGFSNLNGLVHISNQVAPNALPGNITTGNITIENLLPTAVSAANRSSITIDSRGNLITGNLSTSVTDGSAGNIKLLANGNIQTGNTLQSLVVNGATNASGGDITALSRNGDIVTGVLVASSIQAGSGTGGAIRLTSNNGSIDTTAGKLQSQSPNGLAGNVTLTAAGDISTRDIDASSNVASGFSVIQLTSNNGAINVYNGTLSTKNTGAGFAGDIRLTAATDIGVFNSNLTNDGYFGIIDLRTIGNPSSTITIDNSTLTATVPSGLPGLGTPIPSSITINSGKIDILNNSTLTATTDSDKANPGKITLTATANPLTIRNSTIRNTVETGKGLASPSFASVSLDAPAITLRGATVDTTTNGIANGATITMQALGQITISEDTDIFSKVGAVATGRGGDVMITGGSVAITGTGSHNPMTNEGTQINASFGSMATTPVTGVGGKVNITATNGIVDITNQALVTTQVSGRGTGGEVTIAGPTTKMTNSTVTTTLASGAEGTSGYITIGNAQTSAIDLQGTTLRSNANGTGNSGRVDIRATQAVAISGGFVGTQAAVSNTTGVAGDVTIQSEGTGTNAIQLNSLNVDAASFSSGGKSGSVRILAVNRGDVTLLGEGRTIFTDTFGSQPTDELRIFGGKIVIDNYRLNATVRSSPNVLGNGADIVIDGNAVEIRNNSQILSVTNAQQVTLPGESASINGKGGNITIVSNGGPISVLSGAQLNASVGTDLGFPTPSIKNGGTIALLSGGGAIQLNSSTITTTVVPGSSGGGGNVILNSNGGQITVLGNAVLDASTSSTGAGGDVFVSSGTGNIQLNSGNLKTTVNAPVNPTDLSGNGGNISVNSGGGTIAIGTATTPFEINSGTAATNTTGTPEQNGKGGSIAVTSGGGQVSLTQATLTAQTSGTKNSGTVTIDANTGAVTVAQASRVLTESTNAATSANAGNLTLITNELNAQGGSEISAATIGLGNAGDLTVRGNGVPTNAIALTGNSFLRVNAQSGNAGTIVLNTRNLSLNNAEITASTTTGIGQDIRITNLENLTAINGEISASTNSGNAGNLLLNQGGTAANAVTLTNSTLSVAANQPRLAIGFGKAGDILLNTQQLTLTDSAVSATTVNGAAGSLNVSADGGAADFIRLNGESELSLSATDAGGIGGTAGGITLNTRELTLAGTSASQRSTITASTTIGTGQDIVLTNLDQLTITNGDIRASTESGNAGSLKLNEGGSAIGSITLTNSNLSVAANQSGLLSSLGNAGNILFNTRQLTLNDSAVFASTVNGLAGSLNVSANGGAADFVRLNGKSQLSLSASNNGGIGGTAGGITLNTRELALAGNSAAERSTITASTTTGTGQNIILTNLNNLSATFGEISTSTTSGMAGSLLLNQGSPAANAITLSNSRLLTQAGSGIAGDILLNARQLTVQDGSDITASTTGSNRAGNFTVNADGATADLVALLGGGQINLQALGSGDGGTVSLNTRQLVLQGSSTASARISTSATSGTGGDILLQNLQTASLDNGQLSTSTVDGEAGKLTVNEGTGPADAITLQNGSQINLAATGAGNAGQVLLNTRQLTLQGSPTQASTIAASTNSGAGGGVVLQGLSTLQLQHGEIAATTQTGIAGNLTVNGGGNAADLVNLDDRSLISLAATGDGQAGNIALNTRQLRVANNSEVSASTAGSRPAGNLTVNANGGTAETIDLLGGSSLTVSATGTGNAGQVSLQAGQITVQGSPTQASTIAASTNAGTSGGVLLQGSALQMNNGEISASTQSGVAGNVSIEATNSVEMSNGSVLRVNSNSGEAGNLTINTGQLFVDPSFISAETETGRAGNVTINAAQSVQIVDNSEVSVRANQNGGSAGNLTINTAALTIDQQSRLTAETRGGTSDGANITITIPDATFPDATFPGATLNPLLLRNGSKITANAFGAANGGNVRITAPFIIGIPAEDSDITSNAEQGNGGRVSITSFGVFGLQFRRRLTPFSDITASSNVGQQGVVSIQTLGIDPSRGLNTLPAVPNDPTKQVAQGCGPVASDSAGRFTVSGRGGLPPTPEEAPTANAVWEDVPAASPTTAAFPVPTTTVAQVITQTPDTSSSTQPPAQVCHVR